MARILNCYNKFTYTIVNFTEHTFYTLGYKVGSHPKKIILCCWAVVLLSALGFLRFHQEKNPMKLWVPPESKFVRDSDWLMSKFQIGFRPNAIQIVADDVLTPEVIRNLLEIDDDVVSMHTDRNVSWGDVCFKIPKVDKTLLSLLKSDSQTGEKPKDAVVTMNSGIYCSFIEVMKDECYKRSILELWNYNATAIKRLTKDDILSTINTYDKNDVLGRLKNFEDLLGGVVRNETGSIIAAKSLHNFWMVLINFTTVDFDQSGNMAGTNDWASLEALEWENKFLTTMKDFNISDNMTLYYAAWRSFGDLSSATMFQDLDILALGVFIMVIYVQFVISKFNWLEARVTLGCVGLLSVGMSFITGCGICSLIGVSYGPVHTSLPFLLMGLGVDDMFVIMACWDDLTDDQKKLPAPERTGLMLKHGGVSITVTSVTDILAFIIGSSTILPSLESYCIYAAVCVLMTFVFAITFFTACFVLDQHRVESNHNGIVFCYKHKKDYKPNECSQRQTSHLVFNYIYNKFILSTTGKICVFAITVICLGFSIQGVTKLEQRFDPLWLTPEHSYFSDYIKMLKTYFPNDGFDGGIYMGALNYSQELPQIKELVERLHNETHIVFDIVSWVDPFREFVLHNFHIDIFNEALDDNHFSLFLSKFLYTPHNAVYQANFRFEKPLECGVPTPKIIMSSIDFRFYYFAGPETYLPAMHKVQDIANEANFTTGDRFATAWSKIFASWVTDEIIDIEVMRNLQLALFCVMACTALLIADIQICFWIFICILLTMVNVCGFMQRWGLTIDLVSCIGLELAIGLCVDYATHIGHTFLTIRDGTRRDRSLKTVTTIGSAVIYGGLSTLIGVFMLSQSEAYTFQAFFKIFFLVVLFGLFHGVVLLPVILSWIGPKPYKLVELTDKDEAEVHLDTIK